MVSRSEHIWYIHWWIFWRSCCRVPAWRCHPHPRSISNRSSTFHPEPAGKLSTQACYQTWLAGQSTIYFDDVSERNLHDIIDNGIFQPLGIWNASPWPFTSISHQFWNCWHGFYTMFIHVPRQSRISSIITSLCDHPWWDRSLSRSKARSMAQIGKWTKTNKWKNKQKSIVTLDRLEISKTCWGHW